MKFGIIQDTADASDANGAQNVAKHVLSRSTIGVASRAATSVAISALYLLAGILSAARVTRGQMIETSRGAVENTRQHMRRPT